ncbi:hypothetical protein [Planococcus dechangensis]|uniref:KTSC domain-containing protein n=1 Tax=Planococcus dechangensis TaxID=1176255 RepID=A0ABV9MC86_9BACL
MEKNKSIITAVIENHEIQSANHRLTLNLTIFSEELKGVEPYNFLYNEIEQFLKDKGYYHLRKS